jgi:gliding motility-associated-like protein
MNSEQHNLSQFTIRLLYLIIVLLLCPFNRADAQRIFDSNTFLPAEFTPTGGSNSKFLAAGDLNNDGKKDLVVSNTSSKTITVFTNTSSAGQINVVATKTINVGNSPTGVAIGDIDADGKPDVVIVNSTDRTLTVLKNTTATGAEISFSTSLIMLAGTSSPYYILITDLNADSKPDLVVSMQDYFNTKAYIAVFQNNSTIGAPAFLPEQNFTAGNKGSLPNFMDAGDLDNDGKPDLAVTTGNNGAFSILRNNTGTDQAISFETEKQFSYGVQGRSIKIADVDDDGKNDVLIVDALQMGIFKNTATAIGDIKLAAAVSYGAASIGLALADFDGDAKVDMVTTRSTEGKIYVYRNRAAKGIIDANTLNATVNYPTKQMYTSEVISADMDNDGKPDVVVANDFNGSISVFKNNVDVTAPAKPIGLTVKPGSTQNVIKWSANTESDIKSYQVFGGTSSNPATLLATVSHPSITYTHTGLTNGTTYYYRIKAVDNVNNESDYTSQASGMPQFPPFISGFSPAAGPVGTIVIITGKNFNINPNANMVFFGGTRAKVNTGTTTQLTVIVPLGATHQPITILNTETELVGVAANAFRVTFNNAIGKRFETTSFLDAVNFKGEDRFFSILKVTDLDGDGKNDVIAAYSTGGTKYVSVFRNKSKTGVIDPNSFDPKMNIEVGEGTRAVDIGDVNGDGKPDIVSGNGSRIYVAINTSVTGAVSFAQKMEFPVGAFPETIQIADVDMDGKPDIISGSYYYANVSVLRNTTASIDNVKFAPSVEYSVAGQTYSLVIKDFDGDNKPEIIAGGIGTASISILYNQSVSGIINTQSFKPYTPLSTGMSSKSMAPGDFNNDGKTDIAIANFSTNGINAVSVFQNTSTLGTVSFSKTDYSIAGKPEHIDAGDLDGDGRVDLVVASQSNNNLALLQNNQTGNTISFEAVVQKASAGSAFIIADLDNDGRSDLAGMQLPNNVNIYRNNIEYVKPAAPTGLKAIPAGLEIDLSWNANTEADLEGYKVYGGTTAAPTKLLATITAPAVTYKHGSLKAGSTYYYRITAFSKNGGESSFSTEVSATLKRDQTIRFAATRTTTYGTADLDPLATSSNTTIPITYLSSDNTVATIANNKIHIVKAGQVSITAKQAGNDTYNPAADVVQVLTINKANQAITIRAGVIKVYGDAPYDPAATSTNTTIPVTYTSSDAAITKIENGKVEIIKAGRVNIIASQAGNENYNPATDKIQVLTINKASQAITMAPTRSEVYGAPAYDPGATSTNITIPIVYESSNTTIARIVNNKVEILKAGQVTITAIQTGNDNYNAAPSVRQILTISAAGQVITMPATATKVYGDAPYDPGATSTNPNIPITYESGDPATARIVNGKVEILKAGQVNIIAKQAGDATHSPAVNVTQVLTINKASQTLTIASTITKTYGDAAYNPGATSSNNTIGITYESSDPSIAKINNGNVEILKAGQVNIVAKQTGNANYSAAANVTQALTINKADQVLTMASTRSEMLGATAYDPGATSTNTTIPITYGSSDAGIARIVNNKVEMLKAGQVIIIAKQAGNNNYNEAPSARQTLTISATSQVITMAATATKVYGDAPYDPGATSTNPAIPVTYQSSNTSIARIVNSKVEILSAGQVTITAKQAGDATHNPAADVTQLLTINKASQTITFAAIPNLTEGDADYLLTATATSGLAVAYESDNTAVAEIVNGKLKVKTSGTANITARQAGNANYTAATPVLRAVVITGLNATITASGPLDICANENVKLTASTANSYRWFKNGQVIAGETGKNLTVNKAGAYTVEATFANGTVKTSAASHVTVVVITATIQASVSTAIEKGTTVKLTASGGTTYGWADDSGIISGQNTNILTVKPQQTTTYKVTVSNANGCTDVAQITITVKADDQLIANNLLTPNGDGINDVWVVKNISEYPDNEVTVFDRAGRTVYHKKNYSNDWNGEYNGSPLAKDTYYYLIKPGSNKRDISGYITIIR